VILVEGPPELCGACGHDHNDVCEEDVPGLYEGSLDAYRCACPSWQPELVCRGHWPEETCADCEGDAL
jgi:hypothetical protein